jgi:hypothetical protein
MVDPILTPGNGFHLGPDGQWKPEKIPEDVLNTAKFSGYLTIKGYRCSVFETPDKQSWGQKSEGTPAMASSLVQRVAAKYLKAQQDITTQLKESLENDEMSAWNRAAQEFFSKVQDDFLPDFDKIHNEAIKNIEKHISKFPKAGHPRVDGHEAVKIRTAIEEYAGDVRQAKEKLNSKLMEMFMKAEEELEPAKVASELVKIANKIDNSKNPKHKLVAQDLKKILVAVDGRIPVHKVKTTILVDRNGEEVEVDLEGEFNASTPARLYGHPDNQSPAEGGDLDAMTITVNGQPFELSEEEMQKAENALYAADADYEEDPPDPMQFASELRKIATKIDKSSSPKQELVMRDLKKLIAAIDQNAPYFVVYSEATGPESFSEGGSLLEALQNYLNIKCDGDREVLAEKCPLTVIERSYPTAREGKQTVLTVAQALELLSE